MFLKLINRSVITFFCFSLSQAQGQTLPKNDDHNAKTNVRIDVDCQHNFNIDTGENQNCLSISRLRFSHRTALKNNTSAFFSINPFAKVAGREDRFASSSSLPDSQKGKFGIVDSYAIDWSPRPNLKVSLLEYGSQPLLPQVSGLTLSAPFTGAGWDQTAVVLNYRLPAAQGVDVKFVFGNGEGENGENLDPQQFFGFSLDAKLMTGLELMLAASSDGNSVGSTKNDWAEYQYSQCEVPITAKDAASGYSTTRLALAAKLNGELEEARGLEIAVGWQRDSFSDLNKSQASAPTLVELAGCERLDAESLFVEDESGDSANTMTHTTIGLSASYRILDTYIIGLDYQSRTIDAGAVNVFEPCDDFIGESCDGRQDAQNTLIQTSWAYGLTVEINPDLFFTGELQTRSYDQTYNRFNFAGTDGESTSTSEIFNARVSYHWN